MLVNDRYESYLVIAVFGNDDLLILVLFSLINL